MAERDLWVLTARCVGATALLPLGDGLLALERRLWLAASLALCLWAGRPALSEPLALVGIGELVSAALAGALAALPLAIAVEAAQMWGDLFDLQRGQTIGSLFDPANGAPTAIMGVYLRNLRRMIIFGQGALPVLFSTLARSVNELSLSNTSGSVLTLVGYSLALTARTFLPIAVALTLAECAWALCVRVGGLHGVGESFTLKLALSLLMLLCLARRGEPASLELPAPVVVVNPSPAQAGF